MCWLPQLPGRKSRAGLCVGLWCQALPLVAGGPVHADGFLGIRIRFLLKKVGYIGLREMEHWPLSAFWDLQPPIWKKQRFLGPPTTHMKKIAEFCWSIGMVWVGLAYGKGVPQLFGKGSLGEIHGRVDSFWFRNVVFVDDNKGWLKQETWAYRHWPRVFHIAIAINCSKYLVVFCKGHDFFGMLLFRRRVGFPINKWMTNPASCGKNTMFICVDMF